MGERAAALGFLAASGLYLAMSLQFPLGSAAKPGAGFFPVAVGLFLCVVAAVFALAAFRRRPALTAVAGRARDADARGRVLATAGGLVGFCLALPWIGYPVAAFLFLVLLLRRLGTSGWATVLVTAVTGAAVSHYVFAVLLAVPLPRGVLFD